MTQTRINRRHRAGRRAAVIAASLALCLIPVNPMSGAIAYASDPQDQSTAVTQSGTTTNGTTTNGTVQSQSQNDDSSSQGTSADRNTTDSTGDRDPQTPQQPSTAGNNTDSTAGSASHATENTDQSQQTQSDTTTNGHETGTDSSTDSDATDDQAAQDSGSTGDADTAGDTNADTTDDSILGDTGDTAKADTATSDTEEKTATESAAGTERTDPDQSKSPAAVLPDGTYIFASTLPGHRLIDVPAASTRNGTKIQLYDNNLTKAQRWNVTNDADGYLTIANANSGKVLDVPAASAKNGARIQQYTPNGTKAQRWIAERTDRGIVIRSALNTKLVLDVSAANPNNGAAVQLYTANGTAAQAWTVTDEAAQVTALARANKGTVPDGIYGFATALSGKRLVEIAAGSQKNGGNAQTYRNNHSSAQRWKVTSDADGFLTLTNVRSGKVLDVSAAGMRNGTNVQQWTPNGSLAQRWIAVRGANGIVMHSALHTSLVLDIAAAQTKDGANVQIYRANGSKAQLWTLDTSAYVHGEIETFQRANTWLGNPKSNEKTAENGDMTQDFEGGTVYWHADGTSVASIEDKWESLGGADGSLGKPADKITVQTTQGYVRMFAKGAIFSTSATDKSKAVTMDANIFSYWNGKGGLKSYLGMPTGNAKTLNGGVSQAFKGGTVFWSKKTGAHGIKNGVFLSKYAALKYEQSKLGFPTSEEQTISGGKSQVFEHGQIHWSSKTGAHATIGAMLDYWSARGWQRGWLGFPTNDELTVKGGASQTFQGGTVFWSSKTGAHGLKGAILQRYAAFKYEQGKLGFPTSDETKTINGGVWQSFQKGTIYWKKGLGAHAVSGNFFTRYRNDGYEHGIHGFPTSDEYLDRGHVRQNFEHGSYWSGGMPSGTYSFGITWAGQPNGYYCVPASGYMMMSAAGRWTSPNGTHLTMDAMARYMGTGPDGTWNDENQRGLNAWLGANYYQMYGYPSYQTLRDRVLHSFETGYAPMLLEHERRGGYHPNGHSNSTFSHAVVVDTYDTKTDRVLIADPLASYGGSQKFWDTLGGFRDAYLRVSVDGDAPGIMATR